MKRRYNDVIVARCARYGRMRGERRKTRVERKTRDERGERRDARE
jgi:hypothetical protein